MGKLAVSSAQKPHAVCVPFPLQGHINPMLTVAKLLHARGFHVTFVNTEFNHRRLLRSRGPHALSGLSSFRFETIPDGLPDSDADSTQDVTALCQSVKNCLPPFRELLRRINVSGGDIPPVSCIVSDGIMSFTLDAAEELGVPNVLFWTPSGCAFMALLHYHHLSEKGFFPLKDESCLTNGYLDTEVKCIPSLENMRLKDFPSFVRTTNPDDVMFRFFVHETNRSKRAAAIFLNTFDDLEHDVIRSMQSILPPVYPVGPLQHLAIREIEKDSEIGRLGSNLWKEDTECLAWLRTKAPNSVVYVNFGSVTVMTKKQLVEFAWGLAGSGTDFLWVIRPDIVAGEVAVLPPEFLAETANRGMLTGWCPQEEVLSHPAIGVFLTHSGWNSTLESICGGVPMICWPFFGDQQTNCKFSCDEWGIGVEICTDAKREEVESVVREMIDGEKGKRMREKAEEWQRLAEAAAAAPSGSSFLNFETVVNVFLLGQK